MSPDNFEGSKRNVHTDEFRRSVVDHLLSSGKSAAQVAREFGISHEKVRQWKRRYGPQARPVDKLPPAPQTPEALARENRQLRQELARVMMQRDILKKTMAIFSEP
jgi:transposase